jgi:hypothetical protein
VLFRTGICSVGDWDRDAAAQTKRAVSYRLLRCAEQGRVDVFEGVVRDLHHHSGVSSTTYSRRLADVDAAVNALLARRFPLSQPLLIHDWAASDCITSAEWAGLVLAQFPCARFVASDAHLFLLEVTAGEASYVLEADGTPLQYVRPPFVVPLREPLPRRPVNRMLARRALRRAGELKELVTSCRWPGLEDGTVFQFPPWSVSRLPLVHPEASAFRAAHPAFRIETHSVFEPLGQPADVIRTMNILNRSYFGEARLAQGVRAVFESLRNGGTWVAGRTDEEADPPVNATSILEKRDDRFAVVERIQGGWDLEAMAVAVR